MGRILYDTHIHTPLCKHAQGLPGEYAAVAYRRGFKGIIVTCHSPMPKGFSASVRMAPDEFGNYLSLVARAATEWANRIDVRLGMESDYFPGMEGWLDDLHGRASFDYILGSVHPSIDEYQSRFFHGSWPEFYRQYYRHLADAAETRLFDCLSHPDIVKNQGVGFWNVRELMPVIRIALDRVAGTGIAVELNTSGVNKLVAEMNPGREILREIVARGIPVVVGSDAHVPERVGDGFRKAFEIMREEGFSTVNYFLNRKRLELPLDTALASMPEAEGLCSRAELSDS